MSIFFFLQEVPTSHELWVIPWGGSLSQDRAARTGVFRGEALGVGRWQGCISGSRLYRNSTFASPDLIRLCFSKLSGKWLFFWVLLVGCLKLLLFSCVLGFFFSCSKTAFLIVRSLLSWKLRKHLCSGHLWLPWIKKVMVLVGIFQGLLIRAWTYEMLSRLWVGNTCDFCIAS